MRNITAYFTPVIILLMGIMFTVPVYSTEVITSAGSGFVVNSDGYLVTCEHLVRDAGKIKVTLGTKTWDANIVYVDEVHDLALIKIPVKDLPSLPLSKLDMITAKQKVYAFGYPLTYDLGENIKVTSDNFPGIFVLDEFTAGRPIYEDQKIIVIRTALNEGNNGGCLVNEKGEVIGVINSKLVNRRKFTEMGFSIPINYVKPSLVIENIKFTEEGTKEALDEPSLVKKVSPSVALITIWNETPATLINPIDGAEMVLIPSGGFMMGIGEDQLAAMTKINPNYKTEYGYPIWEMPQHKVVLDAYYIYKNEVTVAQYRKYCEESNRQMPKEPSWGWQDNHPIVNVSWEGARSYANWRKVKLPTEAQWEKAARGTDGRIYPWGNDWDKTKCANNENTIGGKTPSGTHPIGSFPTGASPYGVMDMAGNAFEWCADWQDLSYYKNSPMNNPTGPITGKYRIGRGGSWSYNSKFGYYFRSTYRDLYSNDVGGYAYGFRCASPIPRP